MKNHIVLIGLAWVMFCCAAVHAETIVLAVPGPGSMAFLPAHLAKAIGADRAEGLSLKLRYFPGGPMAMRDLMNNNSDFSVLGLPAIAAARADGEPVVAIGQLSQSPMFVFLLRAKLKNQVRTIAQLKHKRIGTPSSSNQQRSMGKMLTEFLLLRAGLQLNDVQFVSTGLSREAQSAALASATVDALMGDEPFASELVAQGLAIRFVDLYTPKQSSDLLGGSIVRAALATREDVYTQHPETVKKVQRMFDRTLKWLAAHSAQEAAEKLAGQSGFDSPDNKHLVEMLQRYQGLYPNQLAWDAQAVAATERFFHRVAIDSNEKNLLFSDFVRNTPE